jgi:hypothetical protein
MRRMEHGLIVVTLAGLAALLGCEESTDDDYPPVVDDTPNSTLGKAKGFSEDTIADMQERQEAIGRQADTVFDDAAARELEKSGDFPDGGG